LETIVERKVKVLVIEDSNLAQKIMTAMLLKAGYEVNSAFDGLKGISVAKSWAPDVILLDMYMPVMDGLEALKRLKTTKETKSIPVIAVTASERSQKAALENGCDSFLPKPVTMDIVMTAIQTALSNKDANT
jgi:two-component system, cell cycle response regulator DivK